MSSFIKGIAVGLGSFVAGSVALSLLLPDTPRLPPPSMPAVEAPAERPESETVLDVPRQPEEATVPPGEAEDATDNVASLIPPPVEPSEPAATDDASGPEDAPADRDAPEDEATAASDAAPPQAETQTMAETEEGAAGGVAEPEESALTEVAAPEAAASDAPTDAVGADGSAVSIEAATESEAATVADAPAAAPGAPSAAEVAVSPETAQPEVAQPEVAQPETTPPDTSPSETAQTDAPPNVSGQTENEPAPLAPAATGQDAPVPAEQVDGASALVGTPQVPVATTPAPQTVAEPDPAPASPEVAPPAPVMPGPAVPQPVAPDPVPPEPERAAPGQEMPADGQADALTTAAPAPPTAPEAPVAAAPDLSTDPETAAPPALPRVNQMPSAAPGVQIRRGASDESTDAGPRLPGGETGVTIGRLPAIGATDVAPETPVEEATAPASPIESLSRDAALPAYLRYAAQVDLAPGERALGVALLDAPGAEVAVLTLPFTVTMILDPADPAAPQRAALYLDAGHEVALLASGLPPQAQPSDIETAWEVWRRAFPEIVAVMDVAQDGLAENPDAARTLADALAIEGHGAIGQGGGVDAFRAAARAADLAASAVYRRLDDAGQSAPTIRRLLERAAFEAQRAAGILVLGDAGNAETLSVLMGYAQQPSRPGVVLAPASSVLGP